MKKNLEMQVTEILKAIGVPAHIMGYRYSREAIILCVKDRKLMDAITTRLYPAVAVEHGTIPHRVERAIRHAIEVAWRHGDLETINELFGNAVHSDKGKPTNSQFIATIVDKIILDEWRNNS